MMSEAAKIITGTNEAINKRETANELVVMDRVGKVYPTGTVAVTDVSLTVGEGEFISFVGPSGCGKSTIFNMITGLQENTSGKLSVLGTTPKQARQHNEIAFVFQEHTLLPWCSIIDNVTMPLQLRGVSKKERNEAAERVLELVGLKDYTKALPRQLSGGMKMRVSIARALVSRPKLLLMDEPFGALDEITRQTLQEELVSIWSKDQKMSVMFITHNVYEAVYLSNKIVVMTPRPGKVSEVIEVPNKNRDEEFRTSPEFNQYLRRASEALKH